MALSWKWLAVVGLLLAVAVAGAGLSPRPALAQTPPAWDSNNTITLSSTTTLGTKTLLWTSGIAVPVYNQVLTIYRAAAASSNTQIPGNRGILLWVKYSGDSSEIVSAVNNLTSVQIRNSNNQALFAQNNPIWNIQATSDNTQGISPTHRLAAAGTVVDSTHFTSAGGSLLISIDVANYPVPRSPTRLSVSRSSDNQTATVSWELFDQVSEYEIEREQAITIEAMTTATTQYGNTTRFTVAGTIAGVDEYVDSTVEPGFTYRYRIRAKGGDEGGPNDDGWSAFSAWAVSGGASSADIKAPVGFQAVRADDNSAVVLSWTAPDGEIDGFAVQRQELVIAEGSTIFANPVILADADDLDADATSYTDSTIAPGRTYEYRVSAIEGGIFGQASEWARVSPFVKTFGTAPNNLRLVEDATARILDNRREFWMRWDAVQGANDYDVEVRVYDSAGNRMLERYVYTDPEYFRTAFGRVELRTRGHMTDDGICGDGDGTLETGEDCYTEWTGWYGVGFTPKVAPQPGATPLPDTSIDEFQDDVDELVNQTLDQSGVDVDPSVAVQFAVLVGTALVATGSIVAGWKRGMKPLGVGMAFSATVVSLYLAHLLLGIPVAWPIGAQALIVIPGLVALARQLGAFR